jgi:hypothetical protein
MGFSRPFYLADVNPISIFIHPHEEILDSRNDGRRGKRAETASGNCCTLTGRKTFFVGGGTRRCGEQSKVNKEKFHSDNEFFSRLP